MILASINPFEHVLDTDHWHLFETAHIGFKLPFGTKFVFLQLIAAGLLCALYIPLARKIRNGQAATGWFWNALEVLLTYIRDNVAKPCIGDHDADKYTPYLWTVFLYILFNNLLGMIPFFGSPTGSFWVTGALALAAFGVIHGAAIFKHGPVHYLKSYVPHVDAPGGFFIALFIAGIEIFGHFIKAFVLATRLFANIFAGHTVLAVILMLIAMAKDAGRYLVAPIAVSSVLGVTALSFLELFVAFLQAFVFTYLTAIFLGSTLHPEH